MVKTLLVGAGFTNVEVQADGTCTGIYEDKIYTGLELGVTKVNTDLIDDKCLGLGVSVTTHFSVSKRLDCKKEKKTEVEVLTEGLNSVDTAFNVSPEETLNENNSTFTDVLKIMSNDGERVITEI